MDFTKAHFFMFRNTSVLYEGFNCKRVLRIIKVEISIQFICHKKNPSTQSLKAAVPQKNSRKERKLI